MHKYSIKPYEIGFDKEQVHIGFEVANLWLWPLANDEQDLNRIHSQPNFDPETSWYCFDENKMVGFISMLLPTSEAIDNNNAVLFIPRALPGYEMVSDLLIEQSLATLRKKGIGKVEVQVSTMFKNSTALMEGWGFMPSQDRGWGYKIYYSYNMQQGKLSVGTENVHEVNTSEEYDESADLATKWYKKPKEWCKKRLEEWQATGEVITHAFIRRGGKMVAACMAAPNNVRKDTAAIYFIYVNEAVYLPPLVSRVVQGCIHKECKTLIVDLINEHRGYVDVDVYRSLGFVRSADWAIYEKEL